LSDVTRTKVRCELKRTVMQRAETRTKLHYGRLFK